MIKETLQKFIAEESLSIAQAMAKIDENSKGILFVVDDGRLTGCLTDGDIRRWLIKTGDLHADIVKAMNCQPQKLSTDKKSQAVVVMSKHHINAVPIVDTENQIVDIVFKLADEQLEEKEEKDSLKDVPVIIMAGGKGTRLYPYTKILPKPLIPIGDIPILERIINCFVKYDINQYFLTVNYKKEMIKSYFSELDPNYSVQYVEENKPLGTAGSIRLIKQKFDVPVFVTNCDSIIQADYADIYRYHKESGNAMTIVSALKNVVIPYGVLNSKENGVLISMEEKPSLSYFINTGMYVINPDVIDKIPMDTFFHMTHLADVLMKEGHQVGMYPVSEDSFLDMGELEEMRRMEEKLNIK